MKVMTDAALVHADTAKRFVSMLLKLFLFLQTLHYVALFTEIKIL